MEICSSRSVGNLEKSMINFNYTYERYFNNYLHKNPNGELLTHHKNQIKF